jgi:autotransporter-associated beta strand protein
LFGGTSGAPTTQTLTLGSSGINASASTSYWIGTSSTASILLTAADTEFNIGSTNASYFDGAISGTGFGVKKTGPGHLVWRTTNKTYTGRTWVTAGELFVDVTLALPSAGGEALRVDSGGVCVFRNSQVYGTASNNYTWTVNGVVWGDVGNQTFPSTVFMSGGFLRANSTDTLGAFYVRAGGLNGTLNGYGEVSAPIGIDGAFYVYVPTGNTLTVTGALGTSGAKSGVLIKQAVSAADGGTLDIQSNCLYEGYTDIVRGKLKISGSGKLGNGTYNALIYMLNDGNLEFASSATQTLGAIGGAAGSTGGVTMSGSGVLTLTGSNYHLGGTTLSAGTLALGNDSALGTGTLTISGSSTLDATADRAITNAMSIGSSFTFAGANTLTQSTGGIALTTSPTITVSGPVLTLNGVVSGTGRALTKAGSGTLTLGAANTYDGGTTLSAGTLVLGNNTALGSGGTFTIDGNSTLDVTATRTLARPLNIASSFTFGGTADLTTNGGVTVSVASTVTVNSSGRLTFATGGHSYTQRLTKAGTGTLRVGSGSGAGGITLSAGTLQIDGITTPVGTGTFVIEGGTLDALTSNRTISNAVEMGGSFTFTGTRNLTQQTGAVSLTRAPTIITVSASTLAFNGVVSGTGNSLVKEGTGTLTLGASNTYAGDTYVNEGTLKAANQQALGSGSVLLSPDGTLAALASISGRLDIFGTLTNSGGTLRIGGT